MLTVIVLLCIYQIAERIKSEEDVEMEAQGKGLSITLNATSEFCRALGDIPTYGQSGNRNEIEKDELMVSVSMLSVLNSYFLIILTIDCLHFLNQTPLRKTDIYSDYSQNI